jgi:hypothetical protein
MLRPTRSRLVTESDIVRACRWCNLIKTKSFHVYFVGIFRFACWEAFRGLANAWAIAEVAAAPRLFDESKSQLARL